MVKACKKNAPQIRIELSQSVQNWSPAFTRYILIIRSFNFEM